MGDRKRGDAVNFAPGPAQLPVEVLCDVVVVEAFYVSVKP